MQPDAWLTLRISQHLAGASLEHESVKDIYTKKAIDPMNPEMKWNVIIFRFGHIPAVAFLLDPERL